MPVLTPASPSARGPAPTLIKRTQATQLLERLRNDIVAGHMPPGERLIISALAESVGAGQTPIREALMRLVSEGLVTLEDQRGFSVAPVSRRELVDLTDTRAEIEALAMRSSIENGDDVWEGNLLGAYHRLSKAHKRAEDGHSINPDWEERHNHFHAMLVGACTNGVLLQLRAQLYDRADRYRKLSTRYLKAPRDDLGEHEALMNAALARDCAKAEELLKAHIRLTAQIILAEGTVQAP
ncbi:GntR family transcriptional regulator [Variovorax sp. WS11]|uniref:GntR family transcriptional regulator n=1 Tax=Variovorax sp. WS11 TaxID=1105204 RepID=UPI000D0CBCBE|nr:FCD domain-containing protein [Variovorax sp. WS11]NDZ17515.1 FCD domain-containing protein [Variovorax sp. WS11]PSL85955.1 GntR family transcriptional regulator [Variovorax sp. WS11]